MTNNRHAVTPDGCPVELYAVLPPAGEAEVINGALPGPPATVLELGCGTGRILHGLAALGHEVTGVDQSPEMLAHLRDVPGVCAPIETADLGRTFDAVVLASYLINTPDDAQRAAFLATARRHARAGGVVLLQWHPPEWFDTVQETRVERDDIDFHLHELDRDGALLHAAVTYRAAGQSWRHAFTTRRLDTADLQAALAAAGLRPARWLTPDRAWAAAGA